jgi:Asp-tRNA(Asn)/Glu-tRNA(Gln) amidotransferase A subunit family amidase
VQGSVTAAGSTLRANGEPATRDAALVAALRSAGAIIVGKTVTTQFACFDPPPTRNPWCPTHTPGGSSSGSAASVAAGMVPAAIGSQTGGSITRPAAFCGVAGCKPTFGTVSLDRVVPVAVSLDHPGPIARTVRDLGLVLAALKGEGEGNIDVSRFGRRPPRLGRLRGFTEQAVEPVMRQALDCALDQLMAAGALVFDVQVPAGFDSLLRSHRLIMAAEAAAWHRERFAQHRDDYLPCVSSLIEDGLAASATDYLDAKEQQRVLTSRMQKLFSGELDALVTPAAIGPAPDNSSTGDPSMNAPWSFTGMPTVSFPIGLSPDGLPLAIQLAGLRDTDRQLLDTAAWCESVIHG